MAAWQPAQSSTLQPFCSSLAKVLFDILRHLLKANNLCLQAGSWEHLIFLFLYPLKAPVFFSL